MNSGQECKKELNFIWDEREVTDGSKTTKLPTDNLDRGKYAEFLTKFLESKNEQEGYVLNINAEWGAGKTHFLRNWHETLKDAYPSIYIDAWAQDYSDDPLLAVISTIIATLQFDKSGYDSARKSLYESMPGLIKAVAPAVAKGIVWKVSGIRVDDVTEAAEQADSHDSKDDFELKKLTAETAGKVTSALVEDHQEKSQSIQSFKIHLLSLIKDYKYQNKIHQNKPTYIFIDELDRCRPSFSIELLETVKHLFDLKGVIFVIATDTGQLQHAIRAVYGNDFSGEQYLGRFFNRSVTLKSPHLRDHVANLPQYQDLAKSIDQKPGCFWPYNINTELALPELLAGFFENYDLPLRNVEKILDQLLAISLSVTTNKCADLILMTAMCCWYHTESSFYRRMQAKKFRDDFKNYNAGDLLEKNNLDTRHIMRTKFSISFNDNMDNVRFTGVERRIRERYKTLPVHNVLLIRLRQLDNQLDEENIIHTLHGSGRELDAKTFIEASVIEPLHREELLTIDEYFDLVELATIMD
ncbi:Uncharacterised protein [BD1-7 clade bacterium]|uniref:KAP NTPase domain-containing protein n=1 Tax=BD1-7 clade bacterium TaxID=2029982 RepID=A0A5S9QW65_9GAMM|nr:Uncharacterised protein [BD1-7 clade bacterium]CAA0122869.1 Uncharacterised protein [BD1-7 clade bacterium]